MRKPKVLTLLICAVLMLGAGAAVAATNTEMEAAIAKALVEKLGSDASTIRVAFFDGKATLSGSPPRGEEKSANFNVTYEIKISK